MKIAITCNEDEKITSNLNEAELYRVYDVERGKVMSSELVRTISAGHRVIAPFLADKDVEALICGEADKQAKRIYARYGLVLYSGHTGDIKEIISSFLEGSFNY